MSKQNNSKAERGQSLHELGISFMVLLLLLGGVIDLGRVFFAYIALRDAAHEGAVYGAYMPSDSSGIINRVRSSSVDPIDLSNTGDVHVNVVLSGTPCAKEGIRVSVTHDFKFIMPLTSSIAGPGIFPITATITETIISPVCN